MVERYSKMKIDLGRAGLEVSGLSGCAVTPVAVLLRSTLVFARLGRAHERSYVRHRIAEDGIDKVGTDERIESAEDGPWLAIGHWLAVKRDHRGHPPTSEV